MNDKDEQDIMSDVINDISSAAEEEAGQAAEALEETAADIDADAETAESDAAAEVPEDAETIIVAFEDELDAARAVRVVNKALRQRNETIYQGAMISRDEGDDFKIEDLRDMGLTDVITGTAEIGLDLGRDGFKLALSAATTGFALIGSGIRLLRKTALLTAGLAGSTMTIPSRRSLNSFEADEEMQDPSEVLEPGTTAVVIVADHETAAELATDLVRSGGALV